MADIGQYGGKATVTASTTPTGHTITGTSDSSWLKIYQTGTTLIASASTNTGANERSAKLTVTVTTTPSSSYSPESTSKSKEYTITQDGTGETTTCSIDIVNESNYSVHLAADGYENDTSLSISIREDIAANSQITVSFTAESVTIEYIGISSNAPSSGYFYCYDSDSGQDVNCYYNGGTWGGDCEMPFYHADDTLYIEFME